jgi:hypothetical protein
MRLEISKRISQEEIDGHQGMDIIQYEKQNLARTIAEKIMEFAEVKSIPDGKQILLQVDLFPHKNVTALLQVYCTFNSTIVRLKADSRLFYIIFFS